MAPLLDPVAQIRQRFRQVRAQVAGPGRGAERPPETRSPWMSTQDLAEFLRLTDRRRPREAALEWATRHGLVSVVVNRERRFARRDVEAALGHGLQSTQRIA